jgi:DNA end-binding protein Ku
MLLELRLQHVEGECFWHNIWASIPCTEDYPRREMAPPPNWKGCLKVSLVSESIAIYPAPEKVRFNKLNRATGNPLKRQKVVSVLGEEVPTKGQVKGYAIGKDQFVPFEDDELSEIAIDSSRTVDIEKFVPNVSIDAL